MESALNCADAVNTASASFSPYQQPLKLAALYLRGGMGAGNYFADVISPAWKPAGQRQRPRRFLISWNK